MLNTWLCIMAITVILNTIFVVSLLSTLDGGQRAMFLIATALLAGGLLFTIRTMQHLNRPH